MSSNELKDCSDDDDLGLTPTPPSSGLSNKLTRTGTPSPPSSSNKRSSTRSNIESLGSSQPCAPGGIERPSEALQSDFLVKEGPDGSSCASWNLTISQVKLEFLNSEGIKVAQSRSTFDPQMISILQSMIRSASDVGYKKASVSKLLNSIAFQEEIQNQVILQLSGNFSNFLATPDCSLKNQDLFSNDLEELLRMDLN